MKKILTLLCLVFPLSSQALFEARLTYNGLVAKDALSEICAGVCTGTVPGMIPMYGLGGDVIVEIPFMPVGLGIRQENLSLSGTSADMGASAKATRTALLVNYRLIDTIVHIGPIFSYGIAHSGSLTMTMNDVAQVDYSASSGESFSVGLEAGIKPLIIIPLKIGAEAGIQTFKLKNGTNSLNSTTSDVDLSGSYIKLFLGLDI